jgi:plastocyanin
MTEVLRWLLAATIGLAGCSPQAPSVELRVATDPGAELRFLPDSVGVGANTPVTILFENKGATPHNLTFEDGSARSKTIVDPGELDTVRVVGRAPGEYVFVCTIHPEMRGRLIVS